MSDKTEKLLNTTLNFIEKMILLEKVSIFDVPFEIRILSKSMYIYACRVNRNYGRAKYIEILNLLKHDIQLMSDSNIEIKKQLLRLYDDMNNNLIYVEETNDSVKEEEEEEKV